MFSSLISILALTIVTIAVPTPRVWERRQENTAISGPTPAYTVPNLQYPYDALEPYISKEIMLVHHDKHHTAYVNNLNNATVTLKYAVAANDISAIIATQSSINFNGGGHINHSLFWENLAKAGTASPPSTGELFTAISNEWGSIPKFITAFNTKLATLQGSGWGWLVKDADGSLDIVLRSNQDPVLAPLVPIIGIDAWEHGYYLQYKNDRNAYLDAVWNVVNWNVASRRYSGKALVKRSEFNDWELARS